MDLNLLNANVNRLLTNIWNVISFLKEFTVDGAKDVSITYLNANGTESTNTFPNIAKQLAGLDSWKVGVQTQLDDKADLLTTAIGNINNDNVDLNTLIQSGIYRVHNGVNAPLSDYAVLVVGGNASNVVFQMWTGTHSHPNKTFKRVLTSNVWSEWVSMDSVGIEQMRVDVTSSRVAGTIYTNTTHRPIEVNIVFFQASAINASGNVFTIKNGVHVRAGSWNGNFTGTYNISFMVPSGISYRFDNNSSASISYWAELR